MADETDQQFKVLLYYKYVKLDNPDEFRDEHKALCEKLGLLGRILVGEEGLNGTVAGPIEAAEAYKEAMWADERFADMQCKEHVTDHNPFPKLKIKSRKEIVTLEDESATVEKGGAHLTPQQWHDMAMDEDAVILDARNNFEWEIGKFKDAILPDIDYFRDFPQWVKDNKEQLEGKKVLMYCTGGIRCERASAVLKNEGLDDVYQLNGGIINYGKEIPDGLWEGSCFVFDDRMAVQVNDDAHHDVISTCRFCETKTDEYFNCCNAECNKLILLCADCKERSNNACSEECSTKHRDGVVKHWDIVERKAVAQPHQKVSQRLAR